MAAALLARGGAGAVSPRDLTRTTSRPHHAADSCGIPYPESARDGKKNDDDNREGGLAVRMCHHVEVDSQALYEGKEDYHQG